MNKTKKEREKLSAPESGKREGRRGRQRETGDIDGWVYALIKVLDFV